MTLLDATVLIDVLRGVESVRERLRARGGVFLTSAIVVDQILYGLRPGEERATQALVEGLDVVAVGHREATIAARWRREHAREGVTLHQADCLIAACALTSGATLATANVKDFPMPELTVEHWPSSS